MKILDILLLLLLIFGAYDGFKEGAIQEIFSLVSFSISKVISLRVLYILKSYGHIHFGALKSYIAFILIFILIAATMLLLGRICSKWLHKAGLGATNKTIGLLIGIGKWAFYISTAIFVADLLDLNFPESYLCHTFLFPIIKKFTPFFISSVASFLPMLDEWIKAIKTVEKSIP